MPSPFRYWFFLMALPCSALAEPVSNSPRDSTSEQAWARLNLKRHLQQMQKDYPFVLWEVKLRNFEHGYEKLKSRLPPNPVDASGEKEVRRLESLADSLRTLRPKVENLIREMYIEVMLMHIEERMIGEKRPFSPQGRLTFQRAMKPYEAGSLRPKTDWLAKFATLEKYLQDARSSWLFGWAQGALATHIDKLLKNSGFAEHADNRQKFIVESQYWERQLILDPLQAAGKIRSLEYDFNAKNQAARNNLTQLLSDLQPEMLLSELLEMARVQGLEFSVETETRIETALLARQIQLLKPVEEALEAWKNLAQTFPALLAKAVKMETHSEQKSVAQSEKTRRENERLEALALEQKKAEVSQREQFRKNLDAWRNVRLTDAGALDSITQQAVSAPSGRLQTGSISNGRHFIPVKSPKFSDTLAFVEKFVVEDSKLDISRMSLEEKASQSSYVFASSSGRTSPADLERFVQNVALGSFETRYRFLSYFAPESWRLGKPLVWKADRQAETQVRDREFSYVDLVADAHRKHPSSSATAASESKSNMPANMLVIFDLRGGIRRFQSFADTRKIIIRPDDLIDGKLRYKFLSYGADQRNIYLYAIDAEIKSSAPAPG